ncbi:hypothetical protein LIER_38638 [Lithospermum erythrorhizon]|uniref:Uncharacterized protein n=1 Tax=Lithospermum erythrorhizon TaxID=34254 RepID=A0AAV3Q5H4_LITER
MDHHIHNCCHKRDVKRGLWSIEEDQKLAEYIKTNGYKNWSVVPTFAGLQRCGKSCRLRWLNYLRPDVKLGNFTEDETNRIIQLHKVLGNKWAKIAKYLPGRTDNEVKNYWNTTIKKRLLRKKKLQHFGNIRTPSIVSSSVRPPIPAIATPIGGDSIGGGSTISGSSDNNNVFSYSSFSGFNNLVSFSPIIIPPSPSSSDNQLSNQNIFQGFGPFSNNSTSNNYQMNFNNTHVSIPEIAISTPTPSIIQNHPPIQSTWTSDNNNYPLNFHQIFNNNEYPLNFHQASHVKSFVPFMFSDIIANIHDENFHAHPPMNNHDSSVMMATAQEENIVTNNYNNVNSIVISDHGMDLLETMMSSSYPPVPSPSLSASSFLEEQPQALINNPAIWSFNNQFLENPNNYMFDSIYPLF